MGRDHTVLGGKKGTHQPQQRERSAEGLAHVGEGRALRADQGHAGWWTPERVAADAAGAAATCWGTWSFFSRSMPVWSARIDEICADAARVGAVRAETGPRAGRGRGRAACRAGLVQGAPWGRGNLLGEHGEGEEAEEDRLEEEQRHQQKVARVDVRAAAEAACGRERGRRAGRAVFDWDWCVRGAPIWPLTGLLVGAVPTVRRPSSTRAYPLSRPVYPTNSTKCFWLLAPTQLLTHGQWWSIFMMQRSHWEQWWARGGLKPLHLLHMGIDPPFSSCRRWLGE